MDINQTYSGDDFTKYTNIESLCWTPETHMLYVNYVGIFKKVNYDLKSVLTLYTSVYFFFFFNEDIVLHGHNAIIGVYTLMKLS